MLPENDNLNPQPSTLNKLLTQGRVCWRRSLRVVQLFGGDHQRPSATSSCHNQHVQSGGSWFSVGTFPCQLSVQRAQIWLHLRCNSHDSRWTIDPRDTFRDTFFRTRGQNKHVGAGGSTPGIDARPFRGPRQRPRQKRPSRFFDFSRFNFTHSF
jgi:hypothetical protein